MPEPYRCSDAARERSDPLLGTAPPQRRLLLVEQESGWGTDALTSLDVPDDVREEVRARTASCGTRVMLIRRPGRQSSPVCLARGWCVVDPAAPAGHRVTWGTWAYPADLLAALDRVAELESWQAAAGEGARPWPAFPGEEHPAPVSATPPGDDEPLLLVCTNGRKDVCCAVRGRPVAGALAERWPEQTWECTHTGGDRFAANVLVLPEGATYGGVDTDGAVAVVDAHRQGRPAPDHLRGQIGLPRPVQAALAGTLSMLGLSWGQARPGGRAVRFGMPEDEVAACAEQLAARGRTVATWAVDVDLADGRRMVAEVTEHLRPAAALTCKAVDAPGHSRVPVFRGLRPQA